LACLGEMVVGHLVMARSCSVVVWLLCEQRARRLLGLL
jgi:hypothetical protein